MHNPSPGRVLQLSQSLERDTTATEPGAVDTSCQTARARAPEPPPAGDTTAPARAGPLHTTADFLLLHILSAAAEEVPKRPTHARRGAGAGAARQGSPKHPPEAAGGSEGAGTWRGARRPGTRPSEAPGARNPPGKPRAAPCSKHRPRAAPPGLGASRWAQPQTPRAAALRPGLQRGGWVRGFLTRPLPGQCQPESAKVISLREGSCVRRTLLDPTWEPPSPPNTAADSGRAGREQQPSPQAGANAQDLRPTQPPPAPHRAHWLSRETSQEPVSEARRAENPNSRLRTSARGDGFLVALGRAARGSRRHGTPAGGPGGCPRHSGRGHSALCAFLSEPPH